MTNFRLVAYSGEHSPSFGRTERDTFVAVYTLQAHPLPPCLRHEVSCDFLARLCSAVEDVTQTFKLNTFKRGVSLLHAQHRRDICAPVMQAGLVAPAKKRCCRSTADMWALVAAGALADTPFLERSVVLSSFCRRPLNNLRRTSPKEAKSPF